MGGGANNSFPEALLCSLFDETAWSLPSHVSVVLSGDEDVCPSVLSFTTSSSFLSFTLDLKRLLPQHGGFSSLSSCSVMFGCLAARATLCSSLPVELSSVSNGGSDGGSRSVSFSECVEDIVCTEYNLSMFLSVNIAERCVSLLTEGQI